MRGGEKISYARFSLKIYGKILCVQYEIQAKIESVIGPSIALWDGVDCKNKSEWVG